jgi:hypothetical protein
VWLDCNRSDRFSGFRHSALATILRRLLPYVQVRRFLLGGLLVAAVAACRDQTATQYAGTAMNDASPERSATLTLTLFSRTDTAYGGVIDIGPPATGTGGVYAWHKGEEIKIVSVGAASGDTIVWTSKLTDRDLGGRFEITGGPRAGQVGTWRAALVKGPPATPATLRSPQGVPVPPVSAIWPLAFIAAWVWWLARWVSRAPRPGSDDTPNELMVAPAPIPLADVRAGIGGWLALFVFGQSVGIVTLLLRIGTLRDQYVTSIGLGAAVRGLQPLVVVEMFVQLVTPLAAIAGLVLIVRRSRLAPRYELALLTFMALYALIDLAVTIPVTAEMERLLGADAAGKSKGIDRSMAAQIITSLAWSLYWVRSRRVRATFGAAALDLTAQTPITAADLALVRPTSPSPKQSRRTIIRVAGVVLGVLAVVVAIGLVETAATPYDLPAGQDIRTVAAGTWTWTTDKKGCANAHTIAFADSGKVMTIVQPSDNIASDSVVTTTYDIKQVTQSSIRGAIRGETRLDGDGKPVVWDLVLVGPDAYRWRQVGWVSPWGYTPRIVRCPASKAAADTTR